MPWLIEQCNTQVVDNQLSEIIDCIIGCTINCPVILLEIAHKNQHQFLHINFYHANPLQALFVGGWFQELSIPVAKDCATVGMHHEIETGASEEDMTDNIDIDYGMLT